MRKQVLAPLEIVGITRVRFNDLTDRGLKALHHPPPIFDAYGSDHPIYLRKICLSPKDA